MLVLRRGQLFSVLCMMVAFLMALTVSGINGDDNVDEVCALPLDIGICRASVPRFYYDAGAGKCEHFIYGGCQGNANNFPSLDACRNRCVKK